MDRIFIVLLLAALCGCGHETTPSSIDSLRGRSDSALSLLEESMAAPTESRVDTIVRLVPYKQEKLVARIQQRVDTVWVRDTVYIVK